mmetsp:Transcript_11395/g.20238  ORF Transcript_11395/g.20238 Transcript_11395/m.20238 type:complete len:95 (-) Transcript_11395:330-614(-)
MEKKMRYVFKIIKWNIKANIINTKALQNRATIPSSYRAISVKPRSRYPSPPLTSSIPTHADEQRKHALQSHEATKPLSPAPTHIVNSRDLHPSR